MSRPGGPDRIGLQAGVRGALGLVRRPGAGQPAHDRKLVAEQQAGAGRERRQRPRGDLRAVAQHLVAALAADRAANPGVQQAQVVVDLRRRADRRARVAQAVLLADGDGRADAVDLVDVRLLHAVEELPRVGRQRLDVAPLTLRVDRVERQRRLAGAADPGDDDELALRQRQIDVLEVVRAGAANDDLRLRRRGRLWHGGSREPAGSLRTISVRTVADDSIDVSGPVQPDVSLPPGLRLARADERRRGRRRPGGAQTMPTDRRRLAELTGAS